MVSTIPRVTADLIHILVNEKGQVQGANPERPQVHLDWCRHHIDVQSEIEVQSVIPEEPKWGFRLRLKAAFGLLTRDAVEGQAFLDSWDIGLMIEPFHFYLATLNAYVSFRSAGIGLGHDVTSTFGVALLLNTTYDNPRANPFLAMYFAF